MDEARHYGKPPSLEAKYRRFRKYFEGRYSVDDLIYALRSHMLQKGECPVVADIEKILNPPPRQISHAEYIRCLDEYKKTRFDNWSPSAMIVHEYERQQREGDEKPEPPADDLKQIGVKTDLKRIESDEGDNVG